MKPEDLEKMAGKEEKNLKKGKLLIMKSTTNYILPFQSFFFFEIKYVNALKMHN